MRLKPVPEISPPAYPTRNEFMAADHLPEGREARERHSDRSHWGKDLAGAAVFFLAISVGGGDTPTVSAAEIPPKHTVEQPAEYTAGQPVEPIVQIAVKNQSKGMTVVAPIFEHGSGHGYTGCIAVAPPSFLSEEEAMQVIKYELAKHGVKLGDGEELKDLIVQIPCHDRYGIGEREPKKQLPLSLPRPLAVDAIDKSKNIAVEYISVNDCDSFEMPSSIISTAYSFNSKKVAADLAESAAKSGNQKRYLGFFYDPMARIKYEFDFDKLSKNRKELTDGKTSSQQSNTDQESKSKKATKPLTYQERKQRSKDESKELLRQQVRDFAVWLEKQGADVQVQKPTTPSKSN